MRQRCAFARTLVHEPKLLLLDQPFGALDAITRRTLNQELLQIYHEQKKTVLMVTNSAPEALRLANRVLVLTDLPATVLREMEVPFTYEERRSGLAKNHIFIEMKDELNAWIRTSAS